MLLVDNREHVVVEAAEIVSDLLTAGTDLRVLAASREPLGVPGEVSLQVPPLPVPTSHSITDGGTAGTFDAVRLFVERAATALPGFELTDVTAPAVTTLCQRLDGLPLAIELAASRVRTFGAVELVEHLDQRFELLSAAHGPSRGDNARYAEPSTGAIDSSMTTHRYSSTGSLSGDRK